MKLFLIYLFLFNLSHWICDYITVTPWMLKAKSIGSSIFPIFIHALHHAVLIFLIMVFTGASWNVIILASLYRLFTHLTIDVLKGKINVWFPSVASPANKMHWVVFGADQFLHFNVIIMIAYYASRVAI